MCDESIVLASFRADGGLLSTKYISTSGVCSDGDVGPSPLADLPTALAVGVLGFSHSNAPDISIIMLFGIERSWKSSRK